MAVACQGIAEGELGGCSHDRVRALARVVEGRGEILTMRPATGQRILAAWVLNPQRVRYCVTRPDRQVEEKMAELLDLSLHPPRRCRVRCRADKTGLPALQRLHPTLPLRPGWGERQEVE